MAKKIYYLSLFLLFLTVKAGTSQTIDWGYMMGGTWTDRAFDIVKDPSGNIYLTGGIANTVNMNPAGATHDVYTLGVNSSDVFLARYNKNFQLTWVFAYGTSQAESGAKLLVDDSLNVYIEGEGYGTIDFDPWIGSYLFDCAPSYAFIAKYDKNGNFRAVNRIPRIVMSPPEANIYQDSQKNIYTYSGDTLCKFTPNLQLIWKKRIYGNPELFDGKGFYSVRRFKGPDYLSDNGHQDMIFEKYDQVNGNMIFTRQYAFSTGFISGGYISKAWDDKMIISGRFWGDMSLYGINDTMYVSNSDTGYSPFGSYRLDREFIAMYDTAHNIYWAKAYDTLSPEPYIILTDDNGDILTLGEFESFANFDPDSNVNLTNNGFGNYIARYDSNFRFKAASQFLGDSYYNLIGGFMLDEDTAVICGQFADTIDLDLTPAVFPLVATSVQDIFVARYSDFQIGTSSALPQDKGIPAALDLFPNPSAGLIHLRLNTNLDNAMICISDVLGNILLTRRADRNMMTIDLSAYTRSVYVISLRTEDTMISKRILKID